MIMKKIFIYFALSVLIINHGSGIRFNFIKVVEENTYHKDDTEEEIARKEFKILALIASPNKDLSVSGEMQAILKDNGCLLAYGYGKNKYCLLPNNQK